MSDLAPIIEALQAHLATGRIMPRWDDEIPPTKLPVQAIRCPDGFEMSVQASYFSYSTPRGNDGPWSAVEVGFPSSVPPEFKPYGESDMRIFNFVPIEIVAEVIRQHGGSFEPFGRKL